ncbi:hypothetical protein NDU88_005985 [Pleurodeles waltl]|uniref:Uncharacterized protein n=1 Tax=Pleurodeles waltl TaxID=8319 RepID=A0AAV7WWV0_PLEWA|nr:hypothetical protein NDU88_005985 [Pleurodeles waltl]
MGPLEAASPRPCSLLATRSRNVEEGLKVLSQRCPSMRRAEAALRAECRGGLALHARLSRGKAAVIKSNEIMPQSQGLQHYRHLQKNGFSAHEHFCGLLAIRCHVEEIAQVAGAAELNKRAFRVELFMCVLLPQKDPSA